MRETQNLWDCAQSSSQVVSGLSPSLIKPQSYVTGGGGSVSCLREQMHCKQQQRNNNLATSIFTIAAVPRKAAIFNSIQPSQI